MTDLPVVVLPALLGGQAESWAAVVELAPANINNDVNIIGFQSTVITLHPIVRVLLGVVESIGDQLLDHGLQGLSQIGHDLVGLATSDQS